MTSPPGHVPFQSAVGFENIFIGPGGVLDYAFLLKNTGPAPIDGFYLRVGPNVGVVPGPLTAAGILLRTTTSPGGGDPGFFPVVGVPNDPVPLFGPPSLGIGPGGGVIFDEAGATNPFFTLATGLTARFWGFEQFDDRIAPAGPVATSYLMRWYARPGQPLFPVGFITRFDLYSFNPPIPGSGGVDPPMLPVFFGIDDGAGDIAEGASPAVIPCDPSTSPACLTDSTTYPADFTGSAFGQVPEPGTILLLGSGLVGLAVWRRMRFDKR
ncbi:MAG TPA: PEP-CTERM sorting domain-containing protein [Nitrospirales bacterium]